VTIDVGTGDGRAVLAAAARDPRTFAIGLDATAGAMAESSRRAAGPARKGGLPNAAFVFAAAETPPAALCGVAALVTVQFPWGSLLRGCVGAEPVVARGVASLVASGGVLELLLAPAVRDRLDGVPTEPAALVDAVGATFAPLGFDLIVRHLATYAEIAASGSTWARRLGAARSNGTGSERAALLLRLVRR
jgi:16S rRNA (adenine(1408)-N(1))-methyltransferase